MILTNLGWNTGNTAIADEALALNWKDHAHPEITDADGVKAAVLRVRNAIPDFRISIRSMIGEDDLVALRGDVKQEGSVSPVMWFIRVGNGRMTEMWTGIESKS
ncbi:ester cyclase [Cohnella caldifontis]|uniref:ester cyclase n=1 Tax=Cohnella caldifontis TaxID=3027471 RepID=UPI0023EC2985|nr:ester cyclase [Cohnella sp. YIM B05605]